MVNEGGIVMEALATPALWGSPLGIAMVCVSVGFLLAGLGVLVWGAGSSSLIHQRRSPPEPTPCNRGATTMEHQRHAARAWSVILKRPWSRPLKTDTC